MGRYCKKKALETLATLTSSEIKILEGIYHHRCLTRPQIEFLIRDQQEQTIRRSSLNTLLELKLVVVAYRDYHNRESFCLTSAGVQIVRQTLGLGENILTKETRKVIHRGYYTAGKLKPTANRFDRQNRVNGFYFNLQAIFEKSPYYRKSPYHFYDYLHCPAHLKVTQCQALLQTRGFNFFIHYEDFDYTPQTVKQLFKEGYIKPLTTANEAGESHFFEELNPVIVLITKTKETADFYRQIFYRIFNDHFSTFQIIIGTEGEIYDYLFKTFIPTAYQHRKNSLLKQFETQFGLNLKYRHLEQEKLHKTYSALFTLNHKAYLVNTFHPLHLNTLYFYFNHYLQVSNLKHGIQTLLVITKHKKELEHQCKLFETVEFTSYRPHTKIFDLTEDKTLRDLYNALK